MGILLFFKFIIKLGQISESTKNAADGFQYYKNFFDKKFVSIGKN